MKYGAAISLAFVAIACFSIIATLDIGWQLSKLPAVKFSFIVPPYLNATEVSYRLPDTDNVLFVSFDASASTLTQYIHYDMPAVFTGQARAETKFKIDVTYYNCNGTGAPPQSAGLNAVYSEVVQNSSTREYALTVTETDDNVVGQFTFIESLWLCPAIVFLLILLPAYGAYQDEKRRRRS